MSKVLPHLGISAVPRLPRDLLASERDLVEVIKSLQRDIYKTADALSRFIVSMGTTEQMSDPEGTGELYVNVDDSVVYYDAPSPVTAAATPAWVPIKTLHENDQNNPHGVTFLQLPDTPDSYSSGRGLAVNPKESGLEYVDFVLEAAFQAHLDDVANPHRVTADQVSAWKGRYSNETEEYALIDMFSLGDANKLLIRLVFGHFSSFRSGFAEMVMSFRDDPPEFEQWHFGHSDASTLRARVRVYDNGDDTYSVYLCSVGQYGGPMAEAFRWIQNLDEMRHVVIGDFSTTPPTGTLIWDSGDHATYPPTLTSSKNLTRPKHLGADLALLSDVPTGGGVTNFDGLEDTPPSKVGSDGRFLAVNEASDAIEYVDPPTGVAQTFDALTDTPGAKMGHSGKMVRVNSQETALEYSSDYVPGTRKIRVDHDPLLDGGGELGPDDVQIRHAVQGAWSMFGNATDGLAYPTVLFGYRITECITGGDQGVWSARSFVDGEGNTHEIRLKHGVITEWLVNGVNEDE